MRTRKSTGEHLSLEKPIDGLGQVEMPNLPNGARQGQEALSLLEAVEDKCCEACRLAMVDALRKLSLAYRPA
jgi:hypothetical protein